jgi:hypothetical protein
MQHRIETQIPPDGRIILDDLPFEEGENVVVVVTKLPPEKPGEKSYPLRGLTAEYKRPFEPVAEDDWSAAQ